MKQRRMERTAFILPFDIIGYGLTQFRRYADAVPMDIKSRFCQLIGDGGGFFCFLVGRGRGEWSLKILRRTKSIQLLLNFSLKMITPARPKAKGTNGEGTGVGTAERVTLSMATIWSTELLGLNTEMCIKNSL